MENRQLKYFIAVAEELSYGRAAKKLHVSQPAVSRQVKLLEEELKVTFFDEEQKREHKRIVLTEEGVYFYKEALKMVQLQRDSMAGLERLRTRKKLLTLGFCSYLPPESLRRVLRIIREGLPEFELRFKEYADQAALLEGLEEDEVMLVAGVLPAEKRGDLVEVVIEEGHYVAVFPCGDARGKAEELSVSVFKQERWIFLQGLRAFEAPGQEVGHVGHAQVLIEEGFGLGILPSFFVQGVKILPYTACRWGICMKRSRTGALHERLNEHIQL